MMFNVKVPHINDQVEQAHLDLIADDQYIAFLSAVDNKRAVEGNLFSDDMQAATMIRDWARAHGSLLAREKLATIIKALRVVLRRYGCSRKQRREQDNQIAE
jgi:hypothetical protein